MVMVVHGQDGSWNVEDERRVESITEVKLFLSSFQTPNHMTLFIPQLLFSRFKFLSSLQHHAHHHENSDNWHERWWPTSNISSFNTTTTMVHQPWSYISAPGYHHTQSPSLPPTLKPGRTGARDATCLEPQVSIFILIFFSLLNNYLQVNYNNEWPPPLTHPKTGRDGTG